MSGPRTVDVVVRKGETVELPGGLRLTFESHSHKRTRVDGPKSPLIVYVTYERAGARHEQVQHNVYTDEDRGWTWGGYRFDLLAHRYDAQMSLRVTAAT